MKAGSRVGIVAAVFIILAVLGLAAYTSLEIYPREYAVLPSAESLSNDYLALERWLAKSGHPVRFESRGTVSRIAAAKERAVLVESSVCDWDNAADFLLPWVRGGGSLVVLLDYLWDDALDDFLSLFGVGIYDDNDYEDDGEYEEDFIENEFEKQRISAAVSEDMADNAPLIPDFDIDCEFFIMEPEIEDVENISVIRDTDGSIRLVTVYVGGGSLTVTGNAVCMFNRYLQREANAQLAWALTAARTTAENPRVLFFRYKYTRKGLFGAIAERGNFLPLGISALLLVVIGFWMVIPQFGLVFRAKQSAAKPIRERFLAEIRFLKKYNALDYYIKIYLRELKTKYGSDFENGTAEIEAALQASGGFLQRFNRYRDIIQSLKYLETKTEGMRWNR